MISPGTFSYPVMIFFSCLSGSLCCCLYRLGQALCVGDSSLHYQENEQTCPEDPEGAGGGEGQAGKTAAQEGMGSSCWASFRSLFCLQGCAQMWYLTFVLVDLDHKWTTDTDSSHQADLCISALSLVTTCDQDL